jgi:ubiquinone/menaquinone biosynthesis C-methylase UbiE
MSDEVYTHGHHSSVVRAHAHRTAEDSAPHLAPLLKPGMVLLDVGCGPGTITTGLADLVAAPDGSGGATGLDRSEDVIAEARRRAAEAGVANVAFEAGNVYDLPFEDASFDVAHTHQVLHHLADPVAALREMRRVVRPGGLVSLREADYSAMSWHPAASALDEWLRVYDSLSRSNGAEPNAGRHLLEWTLAAGFEPGDLTPSASTWIYATPERRRQFGSNWAERVLHSNYAEQALEVGLASRAELDAIARGWHEWAEDPSGVFLMPSVEIIAAVPAD